AAKDGKKGKRNHGVRGVVTAIDLDKDSKDSGTITIRVNAKKNKKAAATAPEPNSEKKIKISKTTKLEVVSGKKGERTSKAITLAELKQGERIAVFEKDGNAEKVVIREGKKGKKAKKNQ